MQNKINKIAKAQIPLKISQNPWNFRFKGIHFLIFHKISLFFGVYLKKKKFVQFLTLFLT